MTIELREQLQSTLGDAYRIAEELTGGGMARVFAAEDLRLGRKVVVKVLSPELAAGVSVERFRREIRLAAQLDHPNIVPVLTAGQSDELIYYTMPLIEGESLRKLLQRDGQLPLEQAVSIAADIAGALTYAQGRNIVHRDIKPDNVLIGPDGRAMVTDFGIARAVERAADLPSVTSTGHTIGTPTYMSPEQAAAEKFIDGRSDIYSLGCVLYEMLAGEPPFTGATARAIIARHLSDPPRSLRVVRPDIPPSVEVAIEKALAKAPAARFQTPQAFIDALTESTRERIGTRAVRGPLLVLGLSVVTVAAIAAGVLYQRDDARDPRRIAVLPFAAPPGDSQLVIVARGVSADLIASLSTPELTVISHPSVERYASNAPPREVADGLNVGTIVYGTIEPAGRDSLRVSVRIVDPDEALRGSASVPAARSSLLALRDSVVQRVAEQLRMQLGPAVQLHEWRTGTSSARAWELRHRAQELVTLGREMWTARAQPQAISAYQAAESLLALASEADPRWVEPVTARGWAVWSRSMLSADTTRAQLIDSALAVAEEGLSRRPADPHGLELRGFLRYMKWQIVLRRAGTELRDSAETDLRRATIADARLARAWNAYSAILQDRGDNAAAAAAARKAIEADPYLRDVAQSYNRLIFSYLDAEQYDSADAMCRSSLRHFAGDPVIRQCELAVLGWSARGPAAVRRAWAAVEADERNSLGPLVNGIWPPSRYLVAAVLARSGMNDSARAVIRRTRATLTAAGRGTEWQMHEAQVWAVLGQRDTSIALLRRAVDQSPALRSRIGNHPWFRPLRGDPRFQALTAGP